jgi:hypothetical protein
MMTFCITAILSWVVAPLVHLFGQLWRLADAAGSPRIRVVAAARC